MSRGHTTDDQESRSFITRRLAKAPQHVVVAYGAVAAFGTYFCMYAFRKPFQAVAYEGYGDQMGIKLKTVFVLSQIIGYAISKYLGIKICSELTKEYRLPILIGFILWAEMALVLFGLAPLHLKLIPLFLNGLPLGMVWGVCVLYLEGRRITEFLIAGLACSYIIASGVVKDVGRLFLSHLDVDVFWMPAVTGLAFLPLFLLFAWLLSHMPAPSPEDRVHRAERKPMTGAEKVEFLRFFRAGIIVHLFGYLLITAFRDVRDAYSAEIWDGLGLGSEPAIFTRCETWVGLAALTVLIIIRYLDSEKWGVIPNLISMATGFVVIGVSTWAFGAGLVGGFAWMLLIGIGGYLAYVPSDTIYYERLIANAKWVSTAVFMSLVMDASGYTGSVAIQLYKNFGAGEISWVAFFRGFCYTLSVLGLMITAFNLYYFPRRVRIRRAQMEERGEGRALP